MTNIQILNSLDNVFIDSVKDVKTLYYIEPINTEDQKKKFLEGRIKEPRFLYRDPEYDSQELERKLNSVEIPNDELGLLYESKRKDILLQNRIVQNRGNKGVVREATTSVYGVPDKELVVHADELLQQIPNTEAPKIVSSERIRDVLQAALYKNGITDWNIELTDKELTTVYVVEKKITIHKDRKFTETDCERLKVHEIEVHVLRAANGYEQPFKIFFLGLPGYLSTEEGMALYFEELTNNTSKEVIRDYAARVIAVDSVCQDLNFRQTFNRLKSHGLTDEQAWGLALRAHRAGGYIKDHIYLDGYRKVKEFAKNGGNFNTLYVGKVGVGDLSLVRKLIQEGLLREAKYKPYFLDRVK